MVSGRAAADIEVARHWIWFILVGALAGRFRRAASFRAAPKKRSVNTTSGRPLA